MKKTTAKIEYVKWGAYKFCHVKFYGFRAERMNEVWKKIDLNLYSTYESIHKQNESRIKNLCNQANDIYKQVKRNKPFYRFWYNKAEKARLAEAEQLFIQADKLKEKNEYLNYKDELYKKVESLLQQNRFVLTHTSYSDYDVITEVWTLEE